MAQISVALRLFKGCLEIHSTIRKENGRHYLGFRAIPHNGESSEKSNGSWTGTGDYGCRLLGLGSTGSRASGLGLEVTA